MYLRMLILVVLLGGFLLIPGCYNFLPLRSEDAQLTLDNHNLQTNLRARKYTWILHTQIESYRIVTTCKQSYFIFLLSLFGYIRMRH